MAPSGGRAAVGDPEDTSNITSRDRPEVSVHSDLGRTHPLLIGGAERPGVDLFEVRSPIDQRLLTGVYQVAGDREVTDAVAAAQAAFAGWSRTPWAERVAVVRRAAAELRASQSRLAGFITHEIGKTPTDAMYDIAEATEVMDYYAAQFEDHHGYEAWLGPGVNGDRALDRLRPYGVWGVISPFNYPMALGGGPAAAALVAGNTVVMKPSSLAPAMGLAFARALAAAGLPAGALNVVTGPVRWENSALMRAGLAGMTFTGSAAVGTKLAQAFGRHGVPVVAEMGGKNPVIVTASADLDVAAEGVIRSAFGFAGQKCSATSRLYVANEVIGAFTERLLEHASNVRVGDPRVASTTVGPVISSDAVLRYKRAIRALKRGNATVMPVGTAASEEAAAFGHFVSPVIVTNLPVDHPLNEQELFLPILTVAPFRTLGDALELAFRSRFGLAAGLYAGTRAEIDLFAQRAEAGVLYVNRRAGATTGARVNVQTFGGWKMSGNSGANSYGPYYLPLYMREQSLTFGIDGEVRWPQ